MHRIHRVSLILLMLCSVCAVFAVQAVPAFADGNDRGYTCTGEYDCGDGSTNSTADQPAPPPQPGAFQGKEDGYKAGYNDTDGTNSVCPRGNTVEYCNAWYAGYAKGQRDRQIGKGLKTAAGIAGVLILRGITKLPIPLPAR